MSLYTLSVSPNEILIVYIAIKLTLNVVMDKYYRVTYFLSFLAYLKCV